jgi:hypothetical protein
MTVMESTTTGGVDFEEFLRQQEAADDGIFEEFFSQEEAKKEIAAMGMQSQARATNSRRVKNKPKHQEKHAEMKRKGKNADAEKTREQKQLDAEKMREEKKAEAVKKREAKKLETVQKREAKKREEEKKKEHKKVAKKIAAQEAEDAEDRHEEDDQGKPKPKAGKVIQLQVNGKPAFDPDKCPTCKSYRLRPEKPSHHPHVVGCPKRKTPYVKQLEKFCSEIAKNNAIPIVFNLRPTQPMLDDFFKVRAAGTKKPPEAFLVANAPSNPSDSTTTSLPEKKSAEPSMYDVVLNTMASTDFVKMYKDVKKNAPLPLVAVAKFLASTPKCDVTKLIPLHTMELTIPIHRQAGQTLSPLYHSIEGLKVLLVDWQVVFPGLALRCPCGTCNGMLKHDRTNFSKNKKLFPLFRLAGAPSWCIVQQYTCLSCKNRVNANDGRLLMSLPEYVRNAYPVDPKYADCPTATFHLDRDCSSLVDELMPTYGNGDMLSRMLVSKVNQDYLRRFSEYLSFWKAYQLATGDTRPPPLYPEKDGVFITAWPPTGDAIRDVFDVACSSCLTSYGVSDHDRCTREIQSVGTNLSFAQDHTHDMVKNYQGNIGAFAAWDCCTETGEIASVVLVKSTKTEDYAHAAESLARRPNFKPKTMYSDTWPHKEKFWKLIFGPGFEGRLGLFHFQQRILRTLRQGHVDYHRAIRDLCHAIYEWEEDSYDALLEALKDGKMGREGGDPKTRKDIMDMELTPNFRKKFAKYLKKKIRPPSVMGQYLTAWFDKYKVNSSDPLRPGSGRPDPLTGKYLFTPETKDTLTEQIKNADQIQDLAGLDEMYLKIPPNPNTKHGLPEYVSLRCESKLEGFHHPLANFANTAMRPSLCDNLNLIGTSRYNVKIRHRIDMATDPLMRPNTTAYWANYPAYWNHSELAHVNLLAEATGYGITPFRNVRPLPEDNGEKFFSEYIVGQRERSASFPSSPLNDRCQCPSCGTNSVPLQHERVPQIDLIEHMMSEQLLKTPIRTSGKIRMPGDPFSLPPQPDSSDEESSDEEHSPENSPQKLFSLTQTAVVVDLSVSPQRVVDLVSPNKDTMKSHNSPDECPPLPWQPSLQQETPDRDQFTQASSLPVLTQGSLPAMTQGTLPPLSMSGITQMTMPQTQSESVPATCQPLPWQDSQERPLPKQSTPEVQPIRRKRKRRSTKQPAAVIVQPQQQQQLSQPLIQMQQYMNQLQNQGLLTQQPFMMFPGFGGFSTMPLYGGQQAPTCQTIPTLPTWTNIQQTKRTKAQHQLCGCAPFLNWLQLPKRNGKPPHEEGCPERK